MIDYEDESADVQESVDSLIMYLFSRHWSMDKNDIAVSAESPPEDQTYMVDPTRYAHVFDVYVADETALVREVPQKWHGRSVYLHPCSLAKLDRLIKQAFAVKAD